MNLIRADKYLTDKGYTESRNRAAELIKAGVVRINGKPVSKPSTMVKRNSPVIIEKSGPGYVSRGALKLEPALEFFNINCKDVVALDCGASTGGFTEILLRRGASHVYAVDVGYGQLHWSLRKNDKVIVMERTNLRTMPENAVTEPLDLVTLDMSFISLKLILEKILKLLAPSGQIVALIKPQFEAGRENVGSGGVIRDARIHKAVLQDMAQWCLKHGYCLENAVASSITGPKGNREFLFHLVPGFDKFAEKHQKLIQQALNT
ncbi:TlyA family RNA methyltransferase [bacterium]|nr:TlyA family RNA methyltransferase [bacterium]